MKIAPLNFVQVKASWRKIIAKIKVIMVEFEKMIEELLSKNVYPMEQRIKKKNKSLIY